MLCSNTALALLHEVHHEGPYLGIKALQEVVIVVAWKRDVDVNVTITHVSIAERTNSFFLLCCHIRQFLDELSCCFNTLIVIFERSWCHVHLY